MFTAVPPRYDLINTLITWGFDRWWRRRAARECLASPPGEVLDLCCGTGDLAINLARLGQNVMVVVGIDYSQPMLELANIKVASSAGGRQVSFLYGDAAALPFPESSFDCVGISFAFRNLTAEGIEKWWQVRCRGNKPTQDKANTKILSPLSALVRFSSGFFTFR